MQLPFTAAQFFEVFRAYNETVCPAQVLLNVLALLRYILSAIIHSMSEYLRIGYICSP